MKTESLATENTETQSAGSPVLNNPSRLGGIRVHPFKKPGKIIVPLAVGLAWGPDPSVIYQEKMDGCFATREWRGAILAGEQMRGGKFIAFDLLRIADAGDIRHESLRNRLCALACMADLLRADGMETVRSSGHGGEFLREVLARGGEGVVRKSLDAPWGIPMEACKRLETFLCRVTGFNGGKQSVQISICHRDTETQSGGNSDVESSLSLGASVAKPCGSVALRAGKCDRVRVGSLLKIEAFGLTAGGKLREPRVCKDTPTSWLVQF